MVKNILSIKHSPDSWQLKEKFDSDNQEKLAETKSRQN
ncbi:hypothetical protein T10_2485 [Trichinella papuae]|uniref:Uncharacterized protein n=1 Tax=Trichinella papuae TaxID=268474 RepID=A0A0V1LWQ1_9BILA|nr:hypothetical protein T10_2485 [Trichinella papuae]